MRYGYFCPKCDKYLEIEKPMQAPHPPCPHCGGELRRDFRGVRIVIPSNFRSDSSMRKMMNAGLDVDEYDQAFGIREDETRMVRDPIY